MTILDTENQCKNESTEVSTGVSLQIISNSSVLPDCVRVGHTKHQFVSAILARPKKPQIKQSLENKIKCKFSCH